MKYIVTYSIEVEAEDSEAADCKAWDRVINTNFYTVDVQLMDEHNKLVEEMDARISRHGTKIHVPYKYED